MTRETPAQRAATAGCELRELGRVRCHSLRSSFQVWCAPL